MPRPFTFLKSLDLIRLLINKGMCGRQNEDDSVQLIKYITKVFPNYQFPSLFAYYFDKHKYFKVQTTFKLKKVTRTHFETTPLLRLVERHV